MNKIEITTEIMETVAQALLYRDDVTFALKKIVPKGSMIADINDLYRRVLAEPKFKQIKEDFVKLEEATLIDDNLNTILLQYNRMLKDAQMERKYEVAARILKEIREIKSIESEHMKFEIKFEIDDHGLLNNKEKEQS